MQSCFKVTNPSLHWETWGSPLGYFGRGRGGDGGSFSHLGPQECIEHPLCPGPSLLWVLGSQW